jgi:hypothetical protein
MCVSRSVSMFFVSSQEQARMSSSSANFKMGSLSYNSVHVVWDAAREGL